MVKRLTGRDPEGFETIARGFIKNSRYRKRTLSSRLRALKKFMVLPFQSTPGKKVLTALNE